MGEEIKEEQKYKYVNRETGLELTGPGDIHYYMCAQNDQIIENLLLGKFRNDGSYYIEKEYLMELLKIDKYISQHDDNKYILIGGVKTHEFKFTLLIENVAGSKKCATLRLIEQILKNDKVELLKTIVARYTDDADQYFMTKVNKVFSIKNKDEIDGNQIDEEVLFNILRRLNEMQIMKKDRIDSLDYISNTYIDEILKILKNNPGKFSELALRKYAVLLEQMEKNVGGKNYYISLRKGLDKILLETSEYLKDKKLAELLDKAKENYTSNYKQVHKEILESIDRKKIEPAKKIKQESKSKSAESGGGSKPKKSASKKKDAPKKSASKKDEKKKDKATKWIETKRFLGATSQEKKEPQNSQQGNFVIGIENGFSDMINSSQELIGFKDKDKDKNKDNSNKSAIIVPNLNINTFDRGME